VSATVQAGKPEEPPLPVTPYYAERINEIPIFIISQQSNSINTYNYEY